MIFIGIGHRSRVGKDTLAKFIIQYLRLHSTNLKIGRISFATELKKTCHNLYGHLGLKDEDYYNKPENEHERDIKLPVINKTPVEIWVDFGTLVGREVYPDTWVDFAHNKAKDFGYSVVLAPDTRFLNETNFILSKGGYVFELENPRVPPRNSIAEQQLKEWMGWTDRFVNDSDLNKLMTIAEHICHKYILKPMKSQPTEVPIDEYYKRIGQKPPEKPKDYIDSFIEWRERGGTPD